jgi:hypothetical protein
MTVVACDHSDRVDNSAERVLLFHLLGMGDSSLIFCVAARKVGGQRIRWVRWVDQSFGMRCP